MSATTGGLRKALASSPGGDPPPPPVEIFLLSTRGRRASNASQLHNHFHYFACPEAADAHRAHEGDNSRIVSVLTSRATYATLFQSRGTSIADVRNLGFVEPFPLPSGPKEAPVEATFKRGDVNGDGEVTLNDPVQLFDALFTRRRRLPCPDAADADDSGDVTLTDGVRSLNWLFLGRRASPAPGPLSCGTDPTPDRLPDCSYDACE